MLPSPSTAHTSRLTGWLFQTSQIIPLSFRDEARTPSGMRAVASCGNNPPNVHRNGGGQDGAVHISRKQIPPTVCMGPKANTLHTRQYLMVKDPHHRSIYVCLLN